MNEGNDMAFNTRDLFGFDKMLTPEIIKVIYWIGIVLAVLAGLGTILAGLWGKSMMGVVTGLLWLVFGPILVRVYCELLIVIFNIYNVLCEIRDRRP